MLSIPGSLRIFIATSPVDCRKSHDGLAALVEQVMIEKPLSGNLFVFTNKRADRIKLLYWDSDGYALWYKKQESECPCFCLVTKLGGFAHNWAIRLARTGGLDASSQACDSRRRVMSRKTITIVPPRAHHAPQSTTSFGVS
jgi:transposase